MRERKSDVRTKEKNPKSFNKTDKGSCCHCIWFQSAWQLLACQYCIALPGFWSFVPKIVSWILFQYTWVAETISVIYYLLFCETSSVHFLVDGFIFWGIHKMRTLTALFLLLILHFLTFNNNSVNARSFPKRLVLVYYFV